ncbi:MAG: 16S rRNA methyltransferase [Anaerolineae bacterium]
MEPKNKIDVDQPVERILKSAKYRNISEDLIRHLVRRELSSGRTSKQAIKAIKNKLHQIAGAYFAGKVRYERWLAALTAAHAQSEEAFRATCLKIMGRHASTRERLDILETFYATTLADLRPIHSILDVACGFNPLAIPWMSLADDATYYAGDIYQDMMAFLNAFFDLAGLRGQAKVGDVITDIPRQQVEVALVLKLLPLLEQVDRSAGINLLRALKADHILVSFPAQSLGGRNKGMAENYEARFRKLIQGEAWTVKRYEFSTELAFLVRK